MTNPAVRKPVLVLTTEPLPLPGCTTSGAGLRAWGLANGLRAAGLDTIIAVTAPHEPRSGSNPTLPDDVKFIARSDIADLINDIRPAVVVLQHWGIARDVPELTVPLVIDLAGPHLLERLYWGTSDIDADVSEKIEALRRADYLVCSGKYQRHYFYPWLIMSGYDLRKTNLPIIPFSTPPLPEPASAPPVPHNPQQCDFVYGGLFLAWQDPTKPLEWLLDELDRAGRGKLHFYGGAHPVIDASGGNFAALQKVLAAHPRVEMHGLLPFDQLVEEYRNYSVAVDLMAFNPERELAFTTRTMIYLYCGLPVIYNDFSELSETIKERQCGWTLPPDDETAFRGIVREILSGAAPLDDLRQNAVACARTFSWDKTVAPLADFCRAPELRETKTAPALAAAALPQQLARLRKERDEARSALETIQGKLLFRLQAGIPAAATILSPLVYLAAWPVALFLWLKMRRTCR